MTNKWTYYNGELGERTGERSPWAASQIIYCRDGKYRRIPSPESGIPPLAYGLPRSMGAFGSELGRLAQVAGLDKRSLKRAKGYRMGALHAYGNAIVPQVAAEFVRAVMEIL